MKAILLNYKKAISTGKVSDLGLGRYLNDFWDYSDSLGEEVLKIEEEALRRLEIR